MVKKLIYKIHVTFMDKMEEIEVRRKLVTFSDDPYAL
jgi:hypothetical protein